MTKQQLARGAQSDDEDEKEDGSLKMIESDEEGEEDGEREDSLDIVDAEHTEPHPNHSESISISSATITMTTTTSETSDAIESTSALISKMMDIEIPPAFIAAERREPLLSYPNIPSLPDTPMEIAEGRKSAEEIKTSSTTQTVDTSNTNGSVDANKTDEHVSSEQKASATFEERLLSLHEMLNFASIGARKPDDSNGKSFFPQRAYEYLSRAPCRFEELWESHKQENIKLCREDTAFLATLKRDAQQTAHVNAKEAATIPEQKNVEAAAGAPRGDGPMQIVDDNDQPESDTLHVDSGGLSDVQSQQQYSQPPTLVRKHPFVATPHAQPTHAPPNKPLAQILPPGTRYSSLTAKEHREFLQLEKAYVENMKNPAVKGLSPAQAARYFELRVIAKKEQEEYKAAQLREAIANKEQYNLINPDIDKQVTQILQRRKARVLEYPRFFRVHSKIDILNVKPAENDPIFQRVEPQQIRQMGKVHTFQFPTPGQHIPENRKLYYEEEAPKEEELSPAAPSSFTIVPDANPPTESGDQAKLPSTKPTTTPNMEVAKKQHRYDQPKYWQKKVSPVVSKDKIAMSFAQKTRCDVVISSSPFLALIDTLAPDFKEEWDIPVTIVETTVPPPISESAPSEATTPTTPQRHKIAFIDKPFLKRWITVREKNELYYKLALESVSLNVSPHSRCVDYSASFKKKAMTHPSSTTHTAPQADKENTSQEQSTQPQQHQPATEQHQQRPEQYSTVTNMDLFCEPTKDYQFDNLMHSVWSFGKELRVLVRYKIHGVIPDATTPTGYKFIGLRSKLEYQLAKGLEEVTPNEAARWWAHHFIRGRDTGFYVGRINARDGNVVSLENAIPLMSKFDRPERSMKRLLVILRTIKTLPPGSYILSHRFKDPNVIIYRSVDASSSSSTSDATNTESVAAPITFDLDLHSEYKNAGSTDRSNVPYVPVVWGSGKPGSSNAANPLQIPYTFPINPQSSSKTSNNDKHKKKNKTSGAKNKKKKKKRKQEGITELDMDDDGSQAGSPSANANAPSDLDYIMTSVL